MIAIVSTLFFTLVITFSQIAYSQRIVEFAGRSWEVKSGFGGPGPNYWSDSEQSVWVDDQGRLHLRLRRIGSKWYGAEVRTVAPTRHGMHRFYVVGRIDQIDQNVVFAPFLYLNDSTELDIEFSRWSNPENPNGQYVLQPGPYIQNDNIHRFNFHLEGTNSTHYINWTASDVTFKSIHGHYPEPPEEHYLIQQWNYSGNRNPSESDSLNIHINLWLFRGQAPTDNQEVEVIITSADLPLLLAVEPFTNNMPDTHTLLQNYPNPFSSYTNIKFSVPTRSFVELSIYNSFASRVEVILSQYLTPGHYTIRWAPTGRQFGVYFCKLRVGRFTETKKLLLQR